MPFEKGQSGNYKGRPKGSKQKKLPAKLDKKALIALEKALNNGEQWAVIEVLKRNYPTLKAVEIKAEVEVGVNAGNVLSFFDLYRDDDDDDVS